MVSTEDIIIITIATVIIIIIAIAVMKEVVHGH